MFNEKSKKDKPMPRILPGGRPFRIQCTVTETDQFQADFLGEYGDMVYSRVGNIKKTIIGITVCLVLVIVILVSRELVNQAAWFPFAFALMYLAYGVYFHFYEYRTNYR